MKKIIVILSFSLLSVSVRAQLFVDFTWCPVYDTTMQTCCIQFQNLTDSSSIDSCHWDFGDGSTSILPEPFHCYSFPGIYFIQLVLHSNGYTHTETDTLTINYLDTTDCNCDSLIGVSEISRDFVLTISPNPLHDETVISIHSSANKKIKSAALSIYNSMGVLVRTENVLPGEKQEINFERRSLPAGIYYFVLTSDGLLQAPPEILIID